MNPLFLLVATLPIHLEPLPEPVVIETPTQINPHPICITSGCSGELCVSFDAPPVNSICLYREEYRCLSQARCELQSDGACGWTKTSEYNSCLSDGQSPTLAPPTLTPKPPVFIIHPTLTSKPNPSLTPTSLPSSTTPSPRSIPTPILIKPTPQPAHPWSYLLNTFKHTFAQLKYLFK